MQGLGAALLVCIVLVVLALVVLAILAPVAEKISYNRLQVQLSQERMQKDGNLTKIMVFVLGIFGLISTVGMVLFFNNAADVRQYQLDAARERRLLEEARLELAAMQARLDAYYAALSANNGGESRELSGPISRSIS